MTNTGSCSWVSCILWVVGWWLLASTLLFMTWNHIICTHTKMKRAKFWHAPLLVATLMAFCWPMSRHRGHHGRHHGKGHCPYMAGAKKDGDCCKDKKGMCAHGGKCADCPNKENCGCPRCAGLAKDK